MEFQFLIDMNLANHAKPSKNSSSKYLFATKQKKIHESFVSKKNRLSFILVIKCKQTLQFLQQTLKQQVFRTFNAKNTVKIR